MEGGAEPELNKIFEEVVESCLLGIKETLHRININHDDFVLGRSVCKKW